MPTTQSDLIADRETQQPPMEMMLGTLMAQHREIIVATYFRRRTTREAAALLGLTPAVAKARLYEAMRELSLMIAVSRVDRAGPCQWYPDDTPSLDQVAPAHRATVRKSKASSARHLKV